MQRMLELSDCVCTSVLDRRILNRLAGSNNKKLSKTNIFKFRIRITELKKPVWVRLE